MIAAVTLVASSFMKLRATTKLGQGMAPLTLLEMVAALLLTLLMIPGPFTGTAVARWSVPVGMLLLVVSTLDHSARLGRHRKLRADTEAGRLERYVKYMSGGDP